jgi:GNAT superfamily N-acetyltransferase
MITIKAITTEGAALDSIRQMFVDYQKELDADLCFQSFNQELAQLLKKYGPPSGTILLAYYNDDMAGCVAVTAMKEVGVCEMKRLYVKPSFRQFKIGQALVEAIIASAATMGYNKMRLDTLQKLQPAIQLYRKFGFTDTSAYYHNPLQEVVYMERELG